MTEIYSLGPIIVLLLAAIIFGYSKYKLRNPSLLEIEKELTPLNSTICTVYLDGKRYAFTRFSIYNDFIVVNNQKSIVLQFSDVRGVTQGKPLFGTTKLSIDHDDDNTPTITLLLKDVDKPKNIIQSKLKKINV